MLGVAAEHDVGAAARHVGRDGERAVAARLRDDLGLALVLLGVQHVVADAAVLELRREHLAGLDRDRAHQHRLAALVALLELVDHRLPLLVLGAVDDVLVVLADHRAVGRHDHDVELVDAGELGGFGVGGAGHARQLLVHAEVVLEGDRRVGLALVLDLHALLGFHRLVQAVAPAAAFHEPAGELVDDDDLAVLHHVVDVELVDHVRAQRVLHHVQVFHVVRRVQVVDAEQLLGRDDALVAEHHRARLLVERVVLGALDQARDDPVHAAELLGVVVDGPGDDERRARLVDQDRVDLVDDPVEVPALGEHLEAPASCCRAGSRSRTRCSGRR